MSKRSYLLVASVLLPALLAANTAFCQRHESRSFYERNDTAFVRAAGVVLLGLSEATIKRVWSSARTAEDSENANTALDDYAWYLGTSIQTLDSLHIPSYVTGSRFICVMEGAKRTTYDRRTFADADGVERFDAFVLDGRSRHKFLTDLQLGDDRALQEAKQILQISDVK